MIEFKINGEYAELMCSGTTKDLVKESLVLLTALHQHLNREDPAVAELYRNFVEAAVSAPASPVWGDSLEVQANVEIPPAISKIINQIRNEKGGAQNG